MPRKVRRDVRSLMRSVWLTNLVVPLAWGLDLLIWQHDNQLRGGGSAAPWLVPVVSGAVFATLLLRHRFPATVFVIQLLWATASGAVMAQYTSLPGVFVALRSLAFRHAAARSACGLLACVVPFGVQLYPGQGLQDWFTGVLMVMLVAGAAWGLGYLSRAADIRAAALETQREAVTAQALRVERLRIARELHDIVAHAVSIIVVQSAGAQIVLADDPERARQALEVIQDIGRQSMGELRRLLHLLRSAADEVDIDELDQQPGLDDLDRLLDTARGAGLVVRKDVEGAPARVDASVGLAAYRLVQEALTNTIKHAGVGATVRVHLAWGDTQLALTVEDRTPLTAAPAGPAPGLSTGHGLLGLRERVTTVGGVLDVRPLPDGFIVHALLPLARREAQPVSDALLS